MTEWIVISGHIVGNERCGFKTCWESDMITHPSVRAAICHGFKTIESDDFRIGRVKNGALEALQFMYEAPRYYDEMEETAAQIGIKCRRTGLDDGPPLPGNRNRRTRKPEGTC